MIHTDYARYLPFEDERWKFDLNVYVHFDKMLVL